MEGTLAGAGDGLAVEQISSMGFDEDTAAAALRAVGGNVSAAVGLLVERGDEGLNNGNFGGSVVGIAGSALPGTDGDANGGGAAAAPSAPSSQVVSAETMAALLDALRQQEPGSLAPFVQGGGGEQPAEVAWGGILSLLLARAQQQMQNGSAGASEAAVSAALPDVNATEELLAQKADGDGEYLCPLCFEAIALGEPIGVLPCGHMFHRSPALPTGADAFPSRITVAGHDCVLVRTGDLSYTHWVCDVCFKNGSGDCFFHDGPMGTENDNGFDVCARCALKHNVLNKDVSEVCGGINSWLTGNVQCPVCRSPALEPDSARRPLAPAVTIVPIRRSNNSGDTSSGSGGGVAVAAAAAAAAGGGGSGGGASDDQESTVADGGAAMSVEGGPETIGLTQLGDIDD